MRCCARAPSLAVLCDVAQILGRRKSAEALDALGALATVHAANDNVAISAIEALGRIGGSGTCDALVAAVELRSFFRTFPAIRALGATGDARAVAPLASLLGDPIYAVEAAGALGDTGRDEALTPLVALLDGGDAALVRAAAGAHDELGRGDDARSRASARAREVVRAHAHAHGAATTRALAAALDHAHAEAAARVARAPAGSRTTRRSRSSSGCSPPTAPSRRRLRARSAKAGPAVELRLGDALRTGGSAARRSLLSLVGALAVDRDLVAACLDDDDPSVRALACEAWARTGDARDVARLFACLGDPDAYVAKAAGAAAQALGGAGTRALALRHATSSDARVRRAAVRIVGYFGDPEGRARPPRGDRATIDPRRSARRRSYGLSARGRARRGRGRSSKRDGRPSLKTRAAAVRALGGTSTRRPSVVATPPPRASDDPDARTRGTRRASSLGRLARRRRQRTTIALAQPRRRSGAGARRRGRSARDARGRPPRVRWRSPPRPVRTTPISAAPRSSAWASRTVDESLTTAGSDAVASAQDVGDAAHRAPRRWRASTAPIVAPTLARASGRRLDESGARRGRRLASTAARAATPRRAPRRSRRRRSLSGPTPLAVLDAAKPDQRAALLAALVDDARRRRAWRCWSACWSRASAPVSRGGARRGADGAEERASRAGSLPAAWRDRGTADARAALALAADADPDDDVRRVAREGLRAR